VLSYHVQGLEFNLQQLKERKKEGRKKGKKERRMERKEERKKERKKKERNKREGGREGGERLLGWMMPKHTRCKFREMNIQEILIASAPYRDFF
jgi:hypothetical protein